MRLQESVSFELAFGDRFDSEKKRAQLARAMLSLPPSFYPMTAYYADRKMRRRITQDSLRDLGEALRFTQTSVHKVSYCVVEIEKKSHPDFYIHVQWGCPRLSGLDSIWGFIPLRITESDKHTIMVVVDWVVELASGPLKAVYGTIETKSEWNDKLTVKIPSPGTDLVAWMENPPPHPKSPPEAITDIVWMNIFGRPYVDLIGRDKLLYCPAHSVTELPSGAIVVQVSESPMDYGTKEYAARCEAVKEHIGREYFFDWNNPERKCPMPKLDVEYAEPRKYTAEELEQLRVRAGIPKPPEPSDAEDREWLEGLREWVERNSEHAERFIELAGGDRASLDYSVDSLKLLDKFVLKRRKRGQEPDVDLVLAASAYLAQVLLRNSSPSGRAALRVDPEKGHAVVELPNGMVAVPMARIANLWNLGRKEETHFYARALLQS